ncbi:MAG TPA: hypothetical protein VKB88_19670 [Bryobacteraceae bacterium]|nr:hypothetical protein [Bryobacteraceae bacterium]
MDGFLEAPVFDSRPDELLTGHRIGAYQLCEPVGQGGMGTVYRAIRCSDFEKQLAIKLVKRGMDTGFVLRRFGRSTRFWPASTTSTSRVCWMAASPMMADLTW